MPDVWLYVIVPVRNVIRMRDSPSRILIGSPLGAVAVLSGLDLGDFVEALREDVAERQGGATGEHGFLYVVGHLVRKGYKVEAVRCATALDLVSLNSLADLDGHV